MQWKRNSDFGGGCVVAPLERLSPFLRRGRNRSFGAITNMHVCLLPNMHACLFPNTHIWVLVAVPSERWWPVRRTGCGRSSATVTVAPSGRLSSLLRSDYSGYRSQVGKCAAVGLKEMLRSDWNGCSRGVGRRATVGIEKMRRTVCKSHEGVAAVCESNIYKLIP